MIQTKDKSEQAKGMIEIFNNANSLQEFKNAMIVMLIRDLGYKDISNEDFVYLELQRHCEENIEQLKLGLLYDGLKKCSDPSRGISQETTEALLADNVFTKWFDKLLNKIYEIAEKYHNEENLTGTFAKKVMSWTESAHARTNTRALFVTNNDQGQSYVLYVQEIIEQKDKQIYLQP